MVKILIMGSRNVYPIFIPFFGCQVSGVSVQDMRLRLPFLTPLAQTELCINLEDKTLLGYLAVNSKNPSYRTRAGRNLTPVYDPV